MSLETDIKKIKKEVCDKNIEHFSSKDIIISFFGALLVGTSFIFKGNLLKVSTQLSSTNLIYIVVTTLIVLTGEIYFIGYSRVRDKKKRPFSQFLVKRLFTIYSMSLFVGILLVFLYGLHTFLKADGIADIIKIVVGVSFPASIGATITDLLKKF